MRRARRSRDIRHLMQTLAALIQIRRIELGKVHQPVIVVKRHMSVPKCHQSTLAKQAQDAVHMDRAQPQRIGEVILRQRAFEPVLAAHAHQRKPRSQLQQEMGHAGVRITPTDPYEMLHDHCLVP